MRAWLAIGWCAGLLLAGTAGALQAPGTEPQGKAAAPGELGPVFESRSAGIAFAPPAGMKKIAKAVADQIVELVNEEKDWQLKVGSSPLREPLPLSKYRDAGGREKSGVLELTVEQLAMNNPGAQVLRQEAIEVNGAQVGLITLRYTRGGVKRLTQQAIIRATDEMYYVMSFTTPAARAGDGTAVEQEARSVFDRVVQTIRVLDRKAIREDQELRLRNATELLEKLREQQIRQALKGEQWLRLQRDGKDVGYSYVVEEVQERAGGSGVVVAIRSRTIPEPEAQVDIGSEMFMTFDRAHETWAHVAENVKKNEKSYGSEFGASDREVRRVLDRDGAAADQRDPKQPALKTSEQHRLTVTRVSKTGNSEPRTWEDLPPYYLPQVLSHLLPRLVPLDTPRGYMFYAYVSEQQQIMSRYIDVLPAQDVGLAGKRIKAVIVQDRVGLEGTTTKHYFTPEGVYLASRTDYDDGEGKTTTVLVLPSDAQTLRDLWAGATLTRPQTPAPPPNLQPNRRAPNGR